MIIIDVEQGTEAWFEHRLGRFTASQFSTLMSGLTTKGFKDLIIEVATEILTEEIEEGFSNEWMQRGIELEPFAATEYENIFGTELHKVGFCIPDEDNFAHEWVGVSPDRLIGDNGLLEIKCPKKTTHWNYITDNRLPNEYKWQVQGQLLITGREYCDFMSYYPKLKPFIIRVYPDKEMHEQLNERFKIAIEQVKNTIEEYNKYEYLK